MEASLDHLLVKPPSHFAPQKVKGFVIGELTMGGNNFGNCIPTARFVKINLGIEEKINFYNNNIKFSNEKYFAMNPSSNIPG